MILESVAFFLKYFQHLLDRLRHHAVGVLHTLTGARFGLKNELLRRGSRGLGNRADH